MQREPGLLRSVLITVLELAHVHAGLASGLAPQPPQRELEAKRETRTHSRTCSANLACSARCWSRHLTLPTCTRRPPTAPCFFLKSLFLLLFFWGRSRRRACCVLRRRNLAHGSGRSVSKKQNINALYATVYLMCARAHCVTACGSTLHHEVRARATEVSDRRLLRNQGKPAPVTR